MESEPDVAMKLLLFFLLSFTPPRPQVIVYVFLNTECPISQQYARELAALHKQYATRGIQFRAVFPSPTDNQLAITQFQQTYKLPFRGHSDKGLALTHRYHARITPEVVLLNPIGAVVYQGAIDDWYVSLGRHRTEPTQHYLRHALDALLAKQPIELAKTEPIGCFIE